MRDGDSVLPVPPVRLTSPDLWQLCFRSADFQKNILQLLRHFFTEDFFHWRTRGRKKTQTSECCNCLKTQPTV
ncbi:unnamed protein product [Urochloa humidicola]